MNTATASPAAGAFEPGRYPRTYRYPASARWMFVAFSVVLAALPAYLLVHAPALRRDVLAATMVVAGTLGLAIWLAATALRTRLVLSADGVEYHGALFSRRLSIEQIQGRRRMPNTRRGVQLVALPGHGTAVRIVGDLQRDEWFDAWFARIPDLDAADHAASLAQVLEDRGLGATPRDVSERLARATWLARVGAIASFVLLLELQYAPLLWNSQVDVAIALLIPIVALLAAGLARGLVTLTPMGLARNDARPSLFPMVVLPSIGLLLRLFTQSNLQQWQPLVLPALVCGALGSALAMALDAGLQRRIGAVLGVAAAMATFAAAAILWLDVHVDRDAVTPMRVAVIERRPGGTLSGTIGLGPAPTSFDWKTVRVARVQLPELQIGGVACLSEHPGLFGLRWAELHRCAGDPPVTPDEAARHWVASVIRPASQREPLVRELLDGDWQSVDIALNAVQKRFEAGAATNVDVEQAFVAFHDVDPALDKPLADWMAHAPGSWAAHMAMALHTEPQVERLSRAGFVPRNSPSFNWEERQSFALAQLKAASGLSPRPALALMAQYRLTAQSWKSVSDWVDRMTVIDPDDIAMRREYLIQYPICPCGGQVPDDPAMRHLLKSHPSERVRNALAAYRLFERGADAGHTAHAVDLYTQALALQPYPQDAYTSHINIAIVLIDQKRLDEAIAELKAAIATLPRNVHAHETLGWVYEMQKKMPQALAEFLVDAQRGQSWAQMRAASFMLTPEAGVPLDRQAGAFWMRRAANAGEALARDILRRHPDLMAEYPPTD